MNQPVKNSFLFLKNFVKQFPLFSDYLEFLRERKGLTKTELAQKVKVTPSYIMMLESGHKKCPAFRLCKKMVDVLDLDPQEKIKFYQAALRERVSEAAETEFYKAISAIADEHSPDPPEEDDGWYLSIYDQGSRMGRVPRISWETVNKLKKITASQLVMDPIELVYCFWLADNVFALAVEDDRMQPEFPFDSLIFVDPDSRFKQGDFVVAKDKNAEKAIWGQLKKVNGKEVLHPFNSKYEDIELDQTRYSMIGRVVESVRMHGDEDS